MQVKKDIKPILRKILWLVENREGGKPAAFIDRIGVKSGHYYGWMSRNSEPKYPIQKRIADEYGVSVDWLNTKEDTSPYSKTEEAHQDTTPPPPPLPQPDTTQRAPRDTALLEQLLDKSHHTLDRYLSLVEQQQQVINNLSDALVNREETPQSKFGHVRVKKHHFRHKTIPSQHPGTNDKI